MAESLKKNPFALRHCLLYIFLHGESIEEPFDDFCKTVGPEVIRKEEFQHWFDQFEQRKFDDKKPVADISEFICNDKHALRACVLYESLKYKHADFKKNDKFIHHPVFSVYMHFCKVIGDDVMEYREFDFWFYRFAHGMLDLKFERDKEQKILELSDMPLDVMENIVEYLDIVDRMLLERTSQSLRSFSQDQKVFHPYLTLDVYDDNVYTSLGEEHRIRYVNRGNHCIMTYRGRVKVLRGVSYLQQAFQDFKKILENPRLYLHTLTISCLYWSMDIDSLEEQMEDVLKFAHLLHVQHLSFDTLSMKALLNILSSLKPGYLTTITIDHDLDEAAIKEIVEMEQWRQAKYFNMRVNLFDGPLHHLYHFHEFTVVRRELLIDDVREMKEVLLKLPDFQTCILRFQYIFDPIPVLQVFGGATERDREICHYPITNSTDYFEIELEPYRLEITRKKR